MRVKEPIDELAEFARHSTASLLAAMERLARIRIRGLSGERVSQDDEDAAFSRLQQIIAETLTLADLFGRRRLLMEAEAAEKASGLLMATPVVPHVVFTEVVEDLVTRWPVLAEPVSVTGIPRWRQIADIYQTRHAFGVARSTDLNLTKKIQEILFTAEERGQERGSTLDILKEVGGWSESYADTVYQTNLNTAYTAGRFREALEPSVTRIIGAFEYNSVRDSDARPNHVAAHGLVASQHDPIWETQATPQGYRCRCSLRLVSKFELAERGLLRKDGTVMRYTPPGYGAAHPDPGFERRARPDRMIYG